MSITDELREWTRNYTVNCSDTRIALVAIANRIDAEHEQQMAERRRSCVFYDAERNYCKVHDEGDMAELGYVRLPVDADGVPIHIGDVLERGKRHGEVIALMLSDNPWGDGNHWAIQLEGEHAPTVFDSLFHRYVPDTWERIIEDAMGRYSDADADALVARCKALAGDAE